MDKITLRPKQLTELLTRFIPSHMPVMITGAKGIGKTEITHQASDLCKSDMLLSHPQVSDPTDAKGYPWIFKDEEGKPRALHIPFAEVEAAMKATNLTTWFWDDFGQATPAVQAAFMQWPLARQLNGHKLPDCVTIVIATNRRSDMAGVSGILEPVKGRFTIVELEPSMEDLTEWQIQHDISPVLIAWHRFKPDLIHECKPTRDLVNSPDPRNWTEVDKIMKLGLSSHVELAAIAGRVGDGAAGEFCAFLKMFRELPSIDGILLNPATAFVPKDPSTLHAVCAAVAMRCNRDNIGQVISYSERLYDMGHGEFAVFMMRDAHRKDPTIATTPEFIKMSAGTVGRLISGD